MASRSAAASLGGIFCSTFSTSNVKTSAAAYFKGALSAQKWEGGLRGPLGKVTSRTAKKTKAASSLPLAPDGKYLVIIYDTSFENKQVAQETLTPMLDADGKWRASGYYIK